MEGLLNASHCASTWNAFLPYSSYQPYEAGTIYYLPLPPEFTDEKLGAKQLVSNLQSRDQKEQRQESHSGLSLSRTWTSNQKDMPTLLK